MTVTQIYSGALSVTIWGLCALMDLFFLFEVIKSTKSLDNIEEQFSKLTDDDLETKTLVSELKNQ